MPGNSICATSRTGTLQHEARRTAFLVNELRYSVFDSVNKTSGKSGRAFMFHAEVNGQISNLMFSDAAR